MDNLSFVVYDHKQGYLQLCCLIDEDEEVNNASHWFPNYTVQEFDDDIAELDQPLSIEGCMLISMSNSDLIHTKNLKNTRSFFASALDWQSPP